MAEESWGTAMLSEKGHYFGSVTIGTDAVYRFEINNVYVEEVKILSAASSCACVEVPTQSFTLASGEKKEIVVRLNTSGQYLHDRKATVAVHLTTNVDGHLLYDTIQLAITGYVRPDIVLTPGKVDFGAVREGEVAERTVTLEYSGRPNWALTKVERTHPYIYARAEEIKRSGSGVTYQITARLRENAPVGYVKDALRFWTNEPTAAGDTTSFVVPIQGVVKAPLQIKPSPFMVGIVKPGETVTKSLVIRNEKPFRVTEVTSSDPRFRFRFSRSTSSVQMISVQFTADSSGGLTKPDFSGTIVVKTDIADQKTLQVSTYGQVFEQNPVADSWLPGNDGPDESKNHAVRFTSPRLNTIKQVQFEE